MASRLDKIVIVGASLAGLRSAQALRRLGFEGQLVAVGDEPHMPYDRPPLSKEVLSGKWDLDRTELLRPADSDLEVDWRLGQRARGLDLDAQQVILADGSGVAFDALVIATGSHARDLPGRPELAGIHLLRTRADCVALRSALDGSPRVAVIGAGFIGAEVAATCRARGLEVSMIEAAPAPLERGLGRQMGDYVGQIHRDQGVDLRCGALVEGFVGTDRVEGLTLQGGETIDADVVVVGIGCGPNTAWLEGSGLELDDGVVCDASCRTTRAPSVLAVGDVARWPNPLCDGPGESSRLEHWTNATEQADAAAANLLAGAGGEPYAPVPFVWSDQYDRKIQIAGRISGDDDKAVVDGSLEDRRFVMVYGRHGRLTGALGMNRPRVVMKVRKLLREGVSFEEAREAF